MPTILSVVFVLFGGFLLWRLPGDRRDLESGKAPSNAASSSAKTLRRVAIGLIIFGVLTYVAQHFVQLEF